MSRSSFWTGLAAGALGGLALRWAADKLLRRESMKRFETGIHIRRPALEVFSACARIEALPQAVRPLVSVQGNNDVSLWTADIDGRRYGWDVEIVQVIPPQLIGWKSQHAPHHSGRIAFFSMGQDTLLEVEMNYAPHGLLGRLIAGRVSWTVGGILESALRDLKLSLESAHEAWGKPAQPAETLREIMKEGETVQEKATGTYGPSRAMPRPAPAEEQRTMDDLASDDES
jgi:uncharacterized membrane protein